LSYHPTHTSFPTRRSSDLDIRKNRHCPFQRRPNRDAEDFFLLTSQINFADAKLRLDCFIEVRATRISFDYLPKRIRRTKILVQLDRKSTRLNSSHEWISYA